VYAYIWRKLPFGLPGKIIGSLLLISVVVSGLWFWGFPAAEPLLPFDDVNVSDENGDRPTSVDPSESLPPDDVIPYDTEQNQPHPSASATSIPIPSPSRR
jgi:hypothetical protein